MNDTSRTNAACVKATETCIDYTGTNFKPMVHSEFALQLQRELNEALMANKAANFLIGAQAEETDHIVTQLRSELEKVKHNLKGARSGARLVYETMLESGKDRDKWRAMAKELADGLVEIEEYWSGNENEKSMQDACKHNVELASKLLTRFNELEKSI